MYFLQDCYEFNPLFSRIFLYTCNAFNSLGKAAIYANILPCITDQMIGASGDELSAAVHWWFWSLQFPFMVLKKFVCALQNNSIVTSLLMLIVNLSYHFLV